MCIPAPHASRTVVTTLSSCWMGATGTACADDARAKAKATAINLSIASSLLLDVLARPAARLRGAVGAKDCTSFLAVPVVSKLVMAWFERGDFRARDCVASLCTIDAIAQTSCRPLPLRPRRRLQSGLRAVRGC